MSLTTFPSWVRVTPSWNEDIIFLLDDELRLQDVNEAWDRFAEANGAPDLNLSMVKGTSVLKHTPEILHKFYNEKYEDAKRSPEPISFQYHCSSPEKIRLFRMEISSMERSFLVVNHLLLEEPCIVREPETSLDMSLYLRPDNIVTMCANCRKTRRVDSPTTWEWVPEFLQEQKFLVSHGLCPSCLTLVYG